MIYNPYYSKIKLKNITKLYSEFINNIKINDRICVKENNNSEVFGVVINKNTMGVYITIPFTDTKMFYTYRNIKYVTKD